MRKNVKNLICLVLSLGLILSLAACGSAGSSTEERTSSATAQEAGAHAASADDRTAPEQTDASASETPADDAGGSDPGSSRVLVVYFSRTGEQYTVGVIDHGNTAIVAEMIAEETGADLFEVLPEDDRYPMTYAELTDVAKREQDENARPAYSGELPDLAGYDTVFIGAPVWWGDWPMIMYTVFESNDFSGKTLIPFSTHEGSGLSGFDRKLASSCPNAEILTGLAVRGNDAQNDRDSVRDAVEEWLSALGC